MEIIQDMGRSYLVIVDETQEELAYMRQMLTYNRIPGIASCQKGLYNNDTVLKYDITNMKSLDKMYESGQMTFEQLRFLLGNINNIIVRGRAFLFEDEGYLLSPNNIFMNIEDNTINLIYVPFRMEKEVIDEVYGRYYSLADFFLDKINHKDEGAVSIAYQFYRMSKEPLFSLDAFMAIVEKEKQTDSDFKNSERMKVTTGNTRPITYSYDEPEEVVDNSAEDERVNYKFSIFLFLLLIVALGGHYCIPAIKQYSYQMIIIEAAVAILFLISLTKNIIAFVKRKRQDIEMPGEIVTLEEFWSGDEETQFFSNGNLGDEETQFFDEEQQPQHFIKWNESGNTRTREIKNSENIIGKKYEEVDLCISDPTISRRHARITIDKKGMWLQDLDSTNGTYVDGNRLLAGENVKIDTSSEIRFGKVEVSVV